MFIRPNDFFTVYFAYDVVHILPSETITLQFTYPKKLSKFGDEI